MQGRVGGFRQASVVGWGEEGAGQGFAFLIRFLVWEGCERNGERKFVPFRICVGKKVFLGGARRGFRFSASGSVGIG